MTTFQCQRDQGSRSSRAGTVAGDRAHRTIPTLPHEFSFFPPSCPYNGDAEGRPPTGRCPNRGFDAPEGRNGPLNPTPPGLFPKRRMGIFFPRGEGPGGDLRASNFWGWGWQNEGGHPTFPRAPLRA